MASLTYGTFGADILNVLGAFVSFRFPRPDLEVTSAPGFVSIKLPTSTPGTSSTTPRIEDPKIEFWGPGVSLTSDGYITGTVNRITFQSTELVTRASIDGLSIPGRDFGNRIDYNLWADLFTRDVTEIQGETQDNRINLFREYENVSQVTLGNRADTLTMGSQIDLNGFIAFGRGGRDMFSFSYGEEALIIEGKTGLVSIGASTKFVLSDFEEYAPRGTGSILFKGARHAEEIRGQTGSDRLFGGGGDDKLFATGNDQIYGGAGNDDLFARGEDEVFGQKGNDFITLYAGFSGEVDGGTGRDTISFGSFTAPVLINLDKQLIREDGKVVARFQSIENANGHGQAATLIGSDGNNSLLGKTGEDVLDGRAGKDKLDGGGGDDMLTGGIGADVFMFHKVSDRIFESRSVGHDTVVDFNPSRDRIEIEGFRLVDSWREVKSNMTERDGDTVIRLAKNDSITLLDVTPDELTKDHFIL